MQDWQPENGAERTLDDIICLMTVIGNDFLPHLPAAELDFGAHSAHRHCSMIACVVLGSLTTIEGTRAAS
jgi:5'-3' exonuclease